MINKDQSHQTYLSLTQVPNRNTASWALVTAGCSPPRFTFKITWIYSATGKAAVSSAYTESLANTNKVNLLSGTTEVYNGKIVAIAPGGGRRLLGYGDSACWQRIVEIIKIEERPDFVCVMPTSSSRIRAASTQAIAQVRVNSCVLG